MQAAAGWDLGGGCHLQFGHWRVPCPHLLLPPAPCTPSPFPTSPPLRGLPPVSGVHLFLSILCQRRKIHILQHLGWLHGDGQRVCDPSAPAHRGMGWDGMGWAGMGWSVGEGPPSHEGGLSLGIFVTSRFGVNQYSVKELLSYHNPRAEVMCCCSFG